ncbi:hypothetical protein [Nostoc sp.]|uniref:hypothetical protein n=1 Tax=Nostoc sp. TaxID=1180 RepID=UPI002FFAC35F
MIISDLKYLENTSEKVLGGFSSKASASVSSTATGALVVVSGVPVPLFNLSTSAVAQALTTPNSSFSSGTSNASVTK